MKTPLIISLLSLSAACAGPRKELVQLDFERPSGDVAAAGGFELRSTDAKITSATIELFSDADGDGTPDDPEAVERIFFGELAVPSTRLEGGPFSSAQTGPVCIEARVVTTQGTYTLKGPWPRAVLQD